MNDRREIYEQRIYTFTTSLNTLKTIRRQLGTYRLLSVAVAGILSYYGFLYATSFGWIIIAAGIIIFLFLVSADVKNNNRIREAQRMIFINNEEINIGNAQYDHRENGLLYLPHDHPYAADLDLFGNASLYQYINRCTSQQGSQMLAAYMLQASLSNEIIERQNAIKELSPQIEWRQQLQSAGMANPLTNVTQQRINTWLHKPTPYNKNVWGIVSIAFPVITLGCLMAYVFGLIPSAIFTMLVFVFYVTSLLISSKISSTYLALSKIVNEVTTLQQQLLHIELLPVSSSLLTSLKKQLQSNNNASKNILELKNVLNRFDMRLNVFVFIFLNTFVLWDLQQMRGLNQWKNLHRNNVMQWFDVLAKMEILNSLATLHFNYPAWAMPVIHPTHFTLKANNIGHPLIRESKRVSNSFSTDSTGVINIITGSNMAGKSTFLRSIGVNIVLAEMGACVCADSFLFSPVKLYTSMRIADNLAEDTSTFYAELKKLKSIIDEVKNHEKIFILLDEILRGTNSLDRHTGSVALVKQLIREQAVAIIATHDVELAKLKDIYATAVHNYHFDVQVEGEELYFDYKLKAGICQSMNASILMKKIGIEL